jgi:hypothetical protein
MKTAAEYRQYAEECLEARRAAMIPEVRAALFTAAQRWIALAEQVEEEEGSTASPYSRRTQANGTAVPAGT